LTLRELEPMARARRRTEWDVMLMATSRMAAVWGGRLGITNPFAKEPEPEECSLADLREMSKGKKRKRE